MRYYFETYELDEAETELLRRHASIGPDMCIVIDGQGRRLDRARFNTCIIILSWTIDENFGLQRIPVGSETPHTRAYWAGQLKRGRYDDKIAKRIADLCGVFDEEPVTQVMGFMLRQTNFRNHDSHLRCAPDELRVIINDAPDHIPSKLAAAGYVED